MLARATHSSALREVHEPLRIALVAAPMEPVPPVAYGGTERVVAALAEELSQRGHDVTVFASGDSKVSTRLVPIIPSALWRRGYQGDVSSFIAMGIAEVWRRADEFDIIHSHVEGPGFLMARHCPTPVLSTLHGRLDSFGMPQLLAAFPDVPLVAISDSQRRWAPGANWVATIHHGLPLERTPFGDHPGEYLAFVGRCTPEKGVADAIEVARRTGLPLRMAGKVHDPEEREYFAHVVQPAIDDSSIEWLGELTPTQRDPLFASAMATLMLGAWPEPFGLVAIESMATGTPVIARRAGALTETIEHGRTGFLVDDMGEARLAVSEASSLDRAEVRRLAVDRFSVERMVDDYEAVYRSLAGKPSSLRPTAVASAPAN
jgi:glycosyltransferase involved in cell wall biosynthesis